MYMISYTGSPHRSSSYTKATSSHAYQPFWTTSQSRTCLRSEDGYSKVITMLTEHLLMLTRTLHDTSAAFTTWFDSITIRRTSGKTYYQFPTLMKRKFSCMGQLSLFDPLLRKYIEKYFQSHINRNWICCDSLMEMKKDIFP